MKKTYSFKGNYYSNLKKAYVVYTLEVERWQQRSYSKVAADIKNKGFFQATYNSQIQQHKVN